MAYRKRVYRKKRPAVKKGRKVYKKKSIYPRQSFAKNVLKVISRNVEHKMATAPQTLTPQTLQAGTTNLAGNLCICTPSTSTYAFFNIVEGLGPNDRIGNKISVKKNVLRYAITLLPYNVSTNTSPMPVIVRMYFFRSKNNPQGAVATGNVTGANANFLDYGSTESGFTGNIVDKLYKIAGASYTYLCHKEFKMGYAQAAGTGVSNVYQQFANNDFKFSHTGTIDLTKYTPKTIEWEAGPSGLDTNVSSKNVQCLIQVLAADGETLATTQLKVNCYLVNELSFTDM